VAGAGDSKKNLYELLGVPSSATEDEIRTAYRSLARKYHPDRNPGDSAAENIFKAITRAYEVLGDAKRRKRYDETLAREQGNVGARKGRKAGRRGPEMMLVFGIFLVLAVVFFFLDTPKGVFFLVVAVGLEIRSAIEGIRRDLGSSRRG
jgi:curved DNA-binding protein CbpA